MLFLSLHSIPLCRESGTRSLNGVFQITLSWANPVELSQQMITLSSLPVALFFMLFMDASFSWVVGLRDLGPENMGRGNSGTRERQDAVRENVGTRARGTQDAKTLGLGDVGCEKRKRWDSGTWDVETRRRDHKQTTRDFRAEFVKYYFRCSGERNYMLESL